MELVVSDDDCYQTMKQRLGRPAHIVQRRLDIAANLVHVNHHAHEKSLRTRINRLLSLATITVTRI